MCCYVIPPSNNSASLSTSLGFAAVVVDDGDPRLGVALRSLLPLVLLRRHPEFLIGTSQSLGATFRFRYRRLLEDQEIYASRVSSMI